MTRSTPGFASVDPAEYIDGLATMVRQYVKEGFEPYIQTFLFRSLPESEKASKQIMQEEASRVYGRFITEVVRNPWSHSNMHNRPVFIGCPDWPVYKTVRRKRHSESQSGIHFAGILLIPPFNRLKAGVEFHFKDKRRAYIRPPSRLSSIHIQNICADVEKAVDYSFKALKRRRCDTDDLLILPSASSERTKS